MDTSVLIAILAFAGVLIGVLAGALGNRALMRRNHGGDNPGLAECGFDREAWDELWTQERQWRKKLWEKHDFLEQEIKDNQILIRSEFKELRGVMEHSLVDALRDAGHEKP